MASSRRDPDQRLPLQLLTADCAWKAGSRSKVQCSCQHAHLTTVLKSNALEYIANGEQVVLVVDTFTMRVLTSCLEMTDILACGYAGETTTQTPGCVVDKFESKQKILSGVGRAAYFPLNVVYYCRPTRANVERILMDYSAPVMPEPDCFERLLAAAELQSKASRDATKQRFLDYFNPDPVVPECAVEFFPLDSNMFSLEMPDALKELYSAAAVVRSEATQVALQERLDTIAFRLSTVCIALNELPHIRYFQRRDADGSSKGRCYPLQLATQLQVHLDQYAAQHPEWTPVGKGAAPAASKRGSGAKNLPTKPATLLVLDRVDDLGAVLMHDLGYQCLMGDILDWVPGIPMGVPNPDTDGMTKVHVSFDDRSDPIFRTLRHTRYPDMPDKLGEVLHALKLQTETVKALGSAATGSDYRKLTTFLAKGGESKLQYRALVHNSMLQEINRLLVNHTFPEVVRVEQDMVTDVEDDGTPTQPSRVLANLRSLLRAPEVLATTKARLLLMWLLTAHKCDVATWDALVASAGLPRPLLSALANAQYLGLPTTRPDRGAVQFMAPPFDHAMMKKRAQSQEEVVRYHPKVRTAVEQLVAGTLDEEAFPYVRRPSAGGAAWQPADDEALPAAPADAAGGDRDAGNVREVLDKYKHRSRDRRGRRFKDRESGAAAADPTSRAGADNLIDRLMADSPPQRKGARIIVFFLGGITPFEASQLETIAAATNREIVY
ncbi:SEC1A, partial [Symbiodinium sp. KB8]